MTKKIFIVHGWEGSPKSDWFPWLKFELEKRKFIVEVLAMPDSDAPVIESWVGFLEKKVKKLNEETYFVGHSIVCEAIVKYLEKIPKNIKVGGCVFVAGWFSLKGLESKEEWEIAKPWIETKIDFKKIKEHTKKFVAIFSDNDPWVPPENKKVFENELNAKIFIEKGKKHLNGEAGVTDLPIVLEEILKMMK